MIDCLDVFESVNTHQIVSRNLNPTRAKETLAPGPETFPTAKVHPMREAKGKAFEGREYCEFFPGRFELVTHDHPQITQIPQI